MRLQSSALFKHLNAYLRETVRAEDPGLNRLSESSSLSSSLRPVVDVIDLFLRYNCQVQIEIWLRDRDTRN